MLMAQPHAIGVCATAQWQLMIAAHFCEKWL
jgi:hypothetical protein